MINSRSHVILWPALETVCFHTSSEHLNSEQIVTLNLKRTRDQAEVTRNWPLGSKTAFSADL